MSTEFYWIAVALVSITSAARLTRLATYDDFPPTRWLRESYGNFMDKRASTRNWAILAYCAYCASFWITALVVLVGWLVDWHEAWWLFNAIMGGSYLAAMVMVHDGEGDD